MKTLILSIAISLLTVINPSYDQRSEPKHAELPNLVKVALVGDKMMPVVDLPEMEVFSDNQPSLAKYNPANGNFVMESDLPGIFVVVKQSFEGRIYRAANVAGTWMPQVNLPTMVISAYSDNYYADNLHKAGIAGS